LVDVQRGAAGRPGTGGSTAGAGGGGRLFSGEWHQLHCGAGGATGHARAAAATPGSTAALVPGPARGVFLRAGLPTDPLDPATGGAGEHGGPVVFRTASGARRGSAARRFVDV